MCDRKAETESNACWWSELWMSLIVIPLLKNVQASHWAFELRQVNRDSPTIEILCIVEPWITTEKWEWIIFCVMISITKEPDGNTTVSTDRIDSTCTGCFLGWVRLDKFLARGSFIRDSEVNKRLCVCVSEALADSGDRLKRWVQEIYDPDLRSMMDWMWSSNPFDKLSFSTTSSFSVWLQRSWDWFTDMFCFIVFLSFLWTTNYVSPFSPQS